MLQYCCNGDANLSRLAMVATHPGHPPRHGGDILARGAPNLLRRRADLSMVTVGGSSHALAQRHTAFSTTARHDDCHRRGRGPRQREQPLRRSTQHQRPLDRTTLTSVSLMAAGPTAGSPPSGGNSWPTIRQNHPRLTRRPMLVRRHQSRPSRANTLRLRRPRLSRISLFRMRMRARE